MIHTELLAWLCSKSYLNKKLCGSQNMFACSILLFLQPMVVFFYHLNIHFVQKAIYLIIYRVTDDKYRPISYNKIKSTGFRFRLAQSKFSQQNFKFLMSWLSAVFVKTWNQGTLNQLNNYVIWIWIRSQVNLLLIKIYFLKIKSRNRKTVKQNFDLNLSAVWEPKTNVQKKLRRHQGIAEQISSLIFVHFEHFDWEDRTNGN